MQRKFWNIRAAEGDPATGEVLLYGPIGPDDGMSWLFDEMSPKQFKADLDGLGDVTDLTVYINSPGGDVFAGQTIYSMLRRHKAGVTVHVDGLAASIASIVAMAGDRVVMPANAMMMIHNPWTVAQGDARDFRHMADTLDQVREAMLAVYQTKSGMERSKLLSLLNAETWMTAAEAVDYGFADQVDEATQVAASLVRPGVATFNGLEVALDRFRNAPDLAALRDAAGRVPTKRDAERALRDAGFSRDAAKALVARGWGEEVRDAPAPDAERQRFDRLYLDYLSRRTS